MAFQKTPFHSTLSRRHCRSYDHLILRSTQTELTVQKSKKPIKVILDCLKHSPKKKIPIGKNQNQFDEPVFHGSLASQYSRNSSVIWSQSSEWVYGAQLDCLWMVTYLSNYIEVTLTSLWCCELYSVPSTMKNNFSEETLTFLT